MRSRFCGLDANTAGQIAANHRGDLFQFVHHAGELIGINGLGAVRESFFRMIVDFDKDSVCA
jgi:hypothetical protein